MASLTPADVKRWDPNAIHGVFQTASNRASTLQRLGDSLQQVHNNLSDWHGEAGDAFRADLGKTRRDIDADGQESKQVAAEVSSAEADVRACKAELDSIEQAADGYGWTITPDWRIDIGNTGIGLDRLTLAAEQQMLQEQLNACKVHAYNADHELATAVRGAVGEVPLVASGHQPGGAPQGAPKAPGGAQPKSWQDMLLPAGAAGAEPGGDPPRGAPVPAGAGAGGKPPTLEDLMLGRGQPAHPGDEQPPPGSLPDLLSRLHQPAGPGAPAPQLKPADVESFKAMARQTMIRDGVPPDQIEARLNDVVGRTQQWMDAGMPNYVPPEPPRPPAPGFAEGFGDRWFATEQGIKDLFGQGGPGAPGVLESWNNMAKGADAVLQNPLGLIAGEVKEAVDAPSAAYYFGEKGADAAVTLPGLMFGPEGAGVGELGELDAAAGLSHPLPGIHPPLSPLEEAFPGLHPALSPLEGPEPAALAGHPPLGPPDAPLSPASAGHPWTDPAEVPVPAGHSPPSPPESPVPAGQVPAEAPVSGGHPASGPHEPPVPGGHPPSGLPEPPGAIEHTPTHIQPPDSQWAPIGFEQPTTYHPEATQAGHDLNDAYLHGQPADGLSHRIADMSTHYIGSNPDRVVLGKWDGQEAGYIGEARGHGGIYYDTGGDTWNAIKHGLSDEQEMDLGWQVNEQFLRGQMERGVPRIEYVLGDDYSSVEEVLSKRQGSFSAREIEFLTENASKYGYRRVGNVWMKG